MSERKWFPIMGGPAIPWVMIEPHEAQAKINHNKTLKRLAERGGLDPMEAVCVLEDRKWMTRDVEAVLTDDAWRARLQALIDVDLRADLAAAEAGAARYREALKRIRRHGSWMDDETETCLLCGVATGPAPLSADDCVYCIAKAALVPEAPKRARATDDGALDYVRTPEQQAAFDAECAKARIEIQKAPTDKDSE